MDIDEAVRRLRANLFLILSCLVVGLGIPAALHSDRGKTYRASARVVMDVAQEPKNQGAAGSISDMARALVTSPSSIEGALDEAKADRDTEAFANTNIRLKTVGTSAILELAVLDKDPLVAATVANSLAESLVAKRQEMAQGRYAPLIADFERRIKAAATEARRLEIEYQRSGGAVALERYRNAARTKEELEGARRGVVQKMAEQPQAQIIDRAKPPTKARPSGLRADLLLGGFLGLFLGVGFAGIRETVHPTVVGGRSVARHLEVPFVGTLTAHPGSGGDPALSAVAARVRLAAEAAGVWTIALTSAGQNAGLPVLADQLQAALDLDERGLRLISTSEPRASLQVLSVEGDGLRVLRDAPATVGLMLVCPTVLKRNDLDPITDLRSMTGWQLLGVVTYPWRTFGRRRRQRKFVAARPVLTASGDIVPGDGGFDGTLDLTDPEMSGERARGRWK